MSRFIPILFLTLFPILAAAQPLVGCREAKQKIRLTEPTPAERAMMLASNERSDTIDILNYEITLDVINFSSQKIYADCVIDFSPKMDNIDYLALDLLDLQLDSVFFEGAPVSYEFDGLLLEIYFPTPLNSTDSVEVQVFYQGTPTVDPTGFGGFDFNGGYAYNLGIGLASNPYNFGRSWFPCFDNFVERSTYDFNILTTGVNKGYCVGTFMGETILPGDTILRRYELDQPIPTYLAGVAISNYSEYNLVHEGAYGPVDIQLVSKTDDLNNMISTFASLSQAVDAIEYWYGPYSWDRVGFVSTVRGAMEHPGNIAYPQSQGLAGDDFDHKRLMAHELAHCWFGDIVTLSSPADMWFKEGNAEYGAHLFTEYILGREAFLDQVNDNFLNDVLKSAHYDDDGFQPLSGIPFEHTYGTHTYQKGASIIHNLRGYLGDSLFRVGQQHVLSTYAYSAVTAEMYRDALIEATGETEKLTSYFDDWVYAPGFAAYEIDSVAISPSGSEFDATVYIQQKLRAAPNFHTNTPIEVTFMDAEWNRYTTEVIATDEFTSVEVTIPFEPEIWFLNGDNKLNTATMSNELIVNEPINNLNLGNAEFQIQVAELTDSAFFRVEHYWVAPDEISNNPDEAKISNNHYWRVDGLWPDVFEASGVLKYRGIFQPELDADLVSNTEDSLILVYRPFPGVDWTEYSDYSKNIQSPTDGDGFIFISSLRRGDYAFANGSLDIVDTEDVFKENHLRLYPNPASEVLILDGDLVKEGSLNYHIYTIEGKLLASDSTDGNVNISKLSNGIYVIQLLDHTGISLGSQQFEIIK